MSDNDKETIRNGLFEQCIKQKDGSIRIPDALVSYMSGTTHIHSR